MGITLCYNENMKNPVLLASLSLIGAIVGAGIFGVPYVFSRAGVLPSLAYCVVLGLAVLLTHWLYALVAAATPGKHRLVGYAQRHLGKAASEIAGITNPMNLLGSLLAYIILGGGFFAALFGGSATIWGLVFFGIMAVLIILPFRKILFVEAGLTWLLIAAAAAIIAAVAPHIRAANLMTADAQQWFLPYGVIFFSFSGASVIPDLVESLGKNMKRIGAAIAIGTVASIVITAAFGVVVAGATGIDTTENAIAGLVPFVGRYIVSFGAVFGILAVATSFLAVGENLKEQFNLDFKFSLPVSWIASMGIPLAAFVFGARSLIAVIGFVGAVFGVIDGVLISLMAWKISAKGTSARWRVLRLSVIPLMVVFALGIVSEIVYLSQ
jgi:amino acid permease